MDVDMSAEEVAFFSRGHDEALPLWAALRGRLVERLPDTELRVQRTQIGLVARHVYGAVSFLPALRKAGRPDPFLTVTIGLSRRLEHPRVAQATEPHPGRWTHHVVIGSSEEADDELVSWLAEARDLALTK